MNSELDTLSTPARQPGTWLLGCLGIVTSMLLSAAYAGFVNLRGLTTLDMGLINFCFTNRTKYRLLVG